VYLWRASQTYSADHTKEKEGLGHRRSDSWGRTALKKAKNVCWDPGNINPGVDQVFTPTVIQPNSKSSHENSVLYIGPLTLDTHGHGESEEGASSAAVGIAIGTPPMESLLATQPVHVGHPYGSPVAFPSLPAFVSPYSDFF
jgi:hypothetical protein